MSKLILFTHDGLNSLIGHVHALKQQTNKQLNEIASGYIEFADSVDDELNSDGSKTVYKLSKTHLKEGETYYNKQLISRDIFKLERTRYVDVESRGDNECSQTTKLDLMW